MGDNTGIEWADATWNPTTGCVPCSAGCRNCYVKYQVWPRMTGAGIPLYAGRQFEDVAFHAERLDQPLRWTRPRRIFVNSLSDLFHEKMGWHDLDRVFAVMAYADWHTFQVLTKRAAEMHAYLSDPKTPVRIAAVLERRCGFDNQGHRNDKCAALAAGLRMSVPLAARVRGMPDAWPLPNVWVGVSVESQEFADQRIPLLLRTPAAVRWISAEPLLGPLNLSGLGVGKGHCPTHDYVGGFCVNGCPDDIGLDWVVVGGESAPRERARPLHPAWALAIRDQCERSQVPFLFKQWGSWGPVATAHGHPAAVALDGTWKAEPSSATVWFARKDHHGRLLAGKAYDGYPGVPTPRVVRDRAAYLELAANIQL